MLIIRQGTEKSERQLEGTFVDERDGSGQGGVIDRQGM